MNCLSEVADVRDPHMELSESRKHGKWVRLRMGKGMCIKIFVFCEPHFTIKELEAIALERLVDHLVEEGAVALLKSS